MKRLNQTLIISTLALFISLPTQAGELHGYSYGQGYGHGSIAKRQNRQDYRIDKGVRRGDLTHYEARKLRKQQRRIDRLFDDFVEDGRLSKRERRALHRKLDKAGQRIKRYLHNEHYRDHSRVRGQTSVWDYTDDVDWDRRRDRRHRRLNHDDYQPL